MYQINEPIKLEGDLLYMNINGLYSSTSSALTSTTSSNTSGNMIFIIIGAIVLVAIIVCVVLAIRLRAKKKKKLANNKNQETNLNAVDTLNQLQPPMQDNVAPDNQMMFAPPVNNNVNQGMQMSGQQATPAGNNQASFQSPNGISPEIVAVIAAAVAATQGKKVEDIDIKSIEKTPDLPFANNTMNRQQTSFVTRPPAPRATSSTQQAAPTSYNAWGTAAINDYTDPF